MAKFDLPFDATQYEPYHGIQLVSETCPECGRLKTQHFGQDWEFCTNCGEIMVHHHEVWYCDRCYREAANG